MKCSYRRPPTVPTPPGGGPEGCHRLAHRCPPAPPLPGEVLCAWDPPLFAPSCWHGGTWLRAHRALRGVGSLGLPVLPWPLGPPGDHLRLRPSAEPKGLCELSLWAAGWREPSGHCGLSLLLCRDNNTSLSHETQVVQLAFLYDGVCTLNRSAPADTLSRVHLHPKRLVPRAAAAAEKIRGGACLRLPIPPFMCLLQAQLIGHLSPKPQSLPMGGSVDFSEIGTPASGLAMLSE